MMHRLEGLKITTAHELMRVEQVSIEEGFSEESYIRKAALEIANATVQSQKKYQKEKKITLLAGKGNNGADGYATLLELMKKGFTVKAFTPFNAQECSYYNKKFRNEFANQGGEIVFFSKEEDFYPLEEGLILDGLLGAGFFGHTAGSLALLINLANESTLPILSIDIPSGLCGNTGQASVFTIRALETFCLALPKTGFFIEQGYHYVGNLHYLDFGLSSKYIDQALGFGFLLEEKSLTHLLMPPLKTQHKYERGYTVIVAGTKGMSGAPLLASKAAFRAGAGIVRLFHQPGLIFSKEDFVEVIKSPWSDVELLKKEIERASSILIGPGCASADENEMVRMKQLIEQTEKPLVVDAEALFMFKEKLRRCPEKTILTPHRQEMKKLLGISHKIGDEDLFEQCQAFVEETKVILILKGAPTFIFESKKPILVIARGDPGMATAGSGDVLAGVLAALLTKSISTKQAAALGVYLHARAGEIGAFQRTSHSLMASDLIEALPEALKELI